MGPFPAEPAWTWRGFNREVGCGGRAAPPPLPPARGRAVAGQDLAAGCGGQGPAAERVQAGLAPRFYAKFRRLPSPDLSGPDSAEQALSVALWFAVVEYLAESASHFLKTFGAGGGGECI